MNAVKSLIKLLVIGIFVMLQLLEIEMLSNGKLSYRESHILLISFIVFLILHCSKLSSPILLLVCIYGIYDFIDSTDKSYVTSMDITGNLRWQPFYESLGGISRRLLSIYPLFFYLGTTISLITTCYRGKLSMILFGKRRSLFKRKL